MFRRAKRLWGSLKRGGPSEMARDVSSYVAWRMSDSPDAAATGTSSGERLAYAEAALSVLTADRLPAPHPRTTPMVTIILPTRQRPRHLDRAIASVQSQTYENWELVVVDDSEYGNPALQFDDPRIRVLTADGKGAGVARNVGLDAANGELIAFLDDDNTMDRLWLQVLVATFEAHPAHSVVIGAQLVQPEPGSLDMPNIRFRPVFDWATLTEYNFVDLGMLSHRRIDDHRFDESLPAFLDWDYVVRLTALHPPRIVPAIAGVYYTDAPERISYQDRRALRDSLRERFRAIAPSSQRPRVASLSHEDVNALEHMLRSMEQNLGHAPRTLVSGEDTGIASLLHRLRIPTDSYRLDSPVTGHYDLLILGSARVPAPPTYGETNEDIVIVGLDAHLGSYKERFPDLPNQRRVGDQLWIATTTNRDLGALLPGVALIKLGFEPEDRADQNND